jgi:hypothetical protein
VRYKEKFRSDLNFGHAIVTASLEHDAAKAKRGLEVGGASIGILCQRIERPDISINDGGQRERFLDPEPADHGAKQRAANSKMSLTSLIESCVTWAPRLGRMRTTESFSSMRNASRTGRRLTSNSSAKASSRMRAPGAYSPPAIAVKTFCDLLGHRTDIQGLQLGLTCA